MYNINRVGENVASTEEYNVSSISSGYIASGFTLVGTMYYSFDSNGKQFRKKYVDASGNEQKYVFEYQDEQNVAVQLPTGAVSHAKSDHLGRKVFDELKLGKGFMNRKFTYHEGVATESHINNDKLVSNPETTLVKQITFADGRTIQYEYDKEERITKVIDSVDGTYEYTYDALDQLLTEKKNGTTVNTMTYDGYGNIKTKNGITYGYNSAWKDKLVSYNGQSIAYDANGNPTTYLGKILVWEKGRQLKSYGSYTYKYNNEGIRISKTISGVEHKYVLDGTNIVKETWGSNTLIPLYDLDGTVCGIKYNGTAYYFYKNLQGDIIAITNSAGTVVARYTYDVWGKCTITSDASGVSIATINPFRYRGYYYDTEIGMYYLQSRYYDPEVGRFINADDASVMIYVYSNFRNLFSYCNNSPTNDKDEFGFTSTYTKNKQVNKMFDIILDSMPNVYSQDFVSRELVKFRIGTTNLNITVSFGVCVQSNKNALFGGLFKKGTLEVSAYLGITNSICFSFSAGITWSRAYLKMGLGAAIPSNKRSGLFAAIAIEVSVHTWLLAVATVAVAVASVYNPAIAAYIVKILAMIKKSIRTAAAVLVPVIPQLVTSF